MCEISRGLFRRLVAFAAVFPLMSALVLSRLSSGIPVEHSALRIAGSDNWISAIVAGNLLLGMVASIGLYWFKKWSRPVAIFTTGVGLCLYCFYTYFLDTGIKIAADQLSTLVAGAVISLAYCSNIAREFH
jgi:hypothetical protein